MLVNYREHVIYSSNGIYLMPVVENELHMIPERGVKSDNIQNFNELL